MAAFNETVFLTKDYTLSVLDYIVLVAVLLLSLGIGVFYSYKQKTSEEYIHGGRQMSLIPVSISMMVSYVSAITMQGITAEVYIYGIDLICETIGSCGVIIVMVTILPIYYDLKPTTVFEYLQKRFQSNIPKLLGSVLTILSLTVYAGAVTYGPSTALESFIGTPTVYNIIVMSVICTIYTSIGGVKAVIATDVIQAVIMIVGLAAVLFTGLARLGLDTVIQELSQTGRTHVSVSPTLTQRYNLWMGMFSSSILMFGVFVNQIAMVRYTGLPTLKQARISVGLSGVSFSLVTVLAICAGAVVFAHYSCLGCGPLEAGVISTPNQIIPYYVMTELNHPGLPGLFTASLLASSLSTLSSVQNGLSAIVWKHLIAPCMPEISEFRKTTILKLIAAVVGAVITAIALGFMMMSGTLMSMIRSTVSMISAPMTGIFVLAAFCPWVGIYAVLIGWACSSSFCLWIALGKIVFGPDWERPDLVTENCPNGLHAINISETLTTSSYELISTDISPGGKSLGVGITVIVGLILSIFPVFRQKRPFDVVLVVPFMRRFVKMSDWTSHSNNIELLTECKSGAKYSDIT